MTHAEFGQEIQAARERAGWHQWQLADRLGCARSSIGGAETGCRPLNRGAIVDAVALFDDTAFTLAVARYMTGGLVGAVAPAISGVRTAAAIAMSVELEELREDLARVKAELLRDPAMAERETVRSVYCNILDVIMTCNQLLIELSRDYGLSLREMQKRHLEEVRAKGYVKQKESRLRPQAA